MIFLKYMILSISLLQSTTAPEEDFKSTCISSKPSDSTSEQAERFCSCLTMITEEDGETRNSLIESWPADDGQAWMESLAGEAAEAVAHCVG